MAITAPYILLLVATLYGSGLLLKKRFSAFSGLNIITKTLLLIGLYKVEPFLAFAYLFHLLELTRIK